MNNLQEEIIKTLGQRNELSDKIIKLQEESIALYKERIEHLENLLTNK